MGTTFTEDRWRHNRTKNSAKMVFTTVHTWIAQVVCGISPPYRKWVFAALMAGCIPFTPIFSGASRSPQDDTVLIFEKYQNLPPYGQVDESLSPARLTLHDLMPEVNQTWTGKVEQNPEHVFLLEEVKEERSAVLYDLGGYQPQIYIFNTADIQEKITDWRRHVYRMQNLAKIDTLNVLDQLSDEELSLYLKMTPYQARVAEIAELTGLDAKIYLSLFWAETNLTHFSYSARRQKWGVIISPKQAWGIAQVTHYGFTQIDRDHAFYRSIPKKRELILREYARSNSIEAVLENVPNVGYYYVRHILSQAGYSLPPDNRAAEFAHLKRDDLYNLNFRSQEKARLFDSHVDKVRLILDTLVGPGAVDRERYKIDPLYAFSVGCAYFYLDYVTFMDEPLLADTNDLIEACVGAYNSGRSGTQYRLRKYKTRWHRAKPKETKGHWRRFQTAYQHLSSIERTFAEARQRQLMAQQRLMNNTP